MVRMLAPREAETLLASGVDLLDVREPHEFAAGHIPNARLVPLDRLRNSFADANVKSPVLFVCARGNRSAAAAALAEANGVAEVYSLDGGTAAWKSEGLPIVIPAPRDSVAAPAPPSDEALPEEPAPELQEIVGANVKDLRTQRGLTLDLLAGLSGVGRQTLGQIELGRTAPSVATLWKIAKAFDVPFSVLLARPSTGATRVLKRAEAKRLVSADGRFSSRALFTPDQKGSVEFYELWLAGHSREDADAHAPGTRENLVVTAGRLVLEIGQARHELGPGDAIVFIADAPHSYVNPGSEECWMNLVMTYGA
jgi:rhodanese-related sulfurtransferase/transcriptional regulator with XRE-family HTH domain